MSIEKKIKEKSEKISIVGLGYVGLPLAIAFAKVADVIGFDISEEKIKQYRTGNDVTKEVGDTELLRTNAFFTSDERKLMECKFHIVAVPTPINPDKTPDLRQLIDATKLVGRNLSKDAIVVFESTVYPGVTEEICIPILEIESGMKCGEDFKVGYSPERINPGDKEHRLQTIVKVVSGVDTESLEIIADVYKMIIKAGVYKAESIKVAEAAKVIENSQRDINIAFMNELSIIFNKMNIDTQDVLKAAGTKWNFLKFTPGLVGGHCIGVDPYYLTYRAEQMGYHSQIILSGRKINDGMGKYVVENTIKLLIKADRQIKGAKVGILGITFKENCPDIRNTKVMDIINELNEYGVQSLVVDPVANKEDLLREYNICKLEFKDLNHVDALIIAVPHTEFSNIELDSLLRLYSHNYPVLIDVKGMYDKSKAISSGFLYWRL